MVGKPYRYGHLKTERFAEVGDLVGSGEELAGQQRTERRAAFAL